MKLKNDSNKYFFEIIAYRARKIIRFTKLKIKKITTKSTDSKKPLKALLLLNYNFEVHKIVNIEKNLNEALRKRHKS